MSNNNFSINGIVNNKEIDRMYSNLDIYQKEYYNTIFKDGIKMICINSPAGTGKTTIAVMAALEQLRQELVSKIYYIRFPDDRSLRLGYLPGDETDKTNSYTKPFFNACEEFGILREQIEFMEENNIINLCTDIAMRGANISDSIVIIDEAQNSRFTDLKLILTRIKDNCKCILIGYSGQNDNFKGEEDHAFEMYIDHMCKKAWAIQCDLPINHRGKLSTWADKLEAPKKEEQPKKVILMVANDEESKRISTIKDMQKSFYKELNTPGAIPI